jgi:hypothetical protein
LNQTNGSFSSSNTFQDTLLSEGMGLNSVAGEQEDAQENPLLENIPQASDNSGENFRLKDINF